MAPRKSSIGFPVDPRVEEWLNSFGINWECATIKMADVDLEGSRRGQARLEDPPVNEEWLASIKRDMERGDKFPPPVLFYSRKGKYQTVDGLHRTQAMSDVSTPWFFAYVVAEGTRLPLIRKMQISANTRHGRLTSEDERKRQAAYLLDDGNSAEEVARVTNLKPGTVKAIKELQAGNRRAVEARVDIDAWTALPGNTRSRLMTIDTNEMLKKATDLVLRAKLDPRMTSELVTEINNSHSLAQQGRTIAAYRGIHRDRIEAVSAGEPVEGVKGFGGKATDRTRYASALGLVKALPPIRSVIENMLDDELHQFLDNIDNAQVRLNIARQEVEKLLAERGVSDG